MSKRRRDRGNAPDDMLNDLSNNEVPEPGFTASGIANEAYNSQVTFGGVSKSVRARATAIDSIYPDPAQPRRIIPSAVRQYWNGQPDADSMARLFEYWLEEIRLERRGQPLELDAHLTSASTERAPFDLNESEVSAGPAMGPLQSAIMPVVDLAASIYRDGLTNPITIAPQGRLSIIETGERRWLAYQLLFWRFGTEDEDWSAIPARTVDGLSIARQATENNARADLNAIAKARQLALLLMDLYATEQNVRFKPFDMFETEQLFYAQVEDGNRWRIPAGKAELLLNMMGLKNAVQLRQYRRLLRLPNVVWLLADDLNWAENFIQKDLLAQAGTDEDLISLAAQQAKREGYTVSTLTDFDLPEKANSGRKQAADEAFGPDIDEGPARLRRILARYKHLDRLDDSARRGFIADIDKAEAWLEALREMLRD